MTHSDRSRLYLILGKRILDLRTEKKLSQEELGKKVHLSRASIVNIEKGRHHPPLHLLMELAECFQVEIWDLIPSRDAFGSEVDSSRLEEAVQKGLTDVEVENRSEAEDNLKEFLKSI